MTRSGSRRRRPRSGSRGHRRESNDLLKEMKKEKEISEDEQFRAQDEVQKVTDDFIKQIDAVTEEKEHEIITF